jgi:hypothetical protein
VDLHKKFNRWPARFVGTVVGYGQATFCAYFAYKSIATPQVKNAILAWTLMLQQK